MAGPALTTTRPLLVISASMQTQCPACQTVFRIHQQQLGAAEGRVRCGVCGEVFMAVYTLKPELHIGGGSAPGAGRRRVQEEDWKEDDTDPSAAQARVPLTERLDEPAEPPLRTVLMGVGIAALAMLLLVQYVYYDRHRLIRSAELAPWVLRLCSVLPCDRPPLRQVDAIELLERSVFVHPNVPGSLMIAGTMVNNAGFAQPLPTLEVSLSNLRGNVIAARRFRPVEYLREGDPDAPMQPGQPIAIRLEVMDPGATALAYEFEFL